MQPALGLGHRDALAASVVLDLFTGQPVHDPRGNQVYHHAGDPVLHYRGLRHGVVANKYWDLGEDDREFKWNNYIGRYHMRHLDLMDVLATQSDKRKAARLLGISLASLYRKLRGEGDEAGSTFAK